MRLIDELDIGPNRAPQPVYEARRARMDEVSRLHWLKHICAREIDKQGISTLTVEDRNDRRILCVWIAVMATTDTWQAIQGLIYRKIKRCLDEEGVNRVLRERFQLEVRVETAPDSLCGEQLFLSQHIRDDLTELAAGPLLPDEHGQKRDAEATPRTELEMSGTREHCIKRAKHRNKNQQYHK